MEGRVGITDTAPEVERLQIELLRAMPPGRKLVLAADLSAAVKVLALAGVRARYPGATEGEVRRRLATLLLGEELARRVYGELRGSGGA
jgi:hypothetical protein